MAHLTNDPSESESPRIFIGLGSNIGDRGANLREANKHIEKLGLQIVRASSIYETEPVGFKDQAWFLNQVVEVSDKSYRAFEQETELTKASALLGDLLAIEDRMGRVRTVRFGPRLIDMDLLFYGSRIIRQAVIEVPHPRLHLRRFVLEPMCEIAPDFIHPALEKNCRELLAALDSL